MGVLKTIATFATGGALVEVGAQAAGFRPIWGVEIVDEIAQVARDNGLHVITGDITKMTPSDFERPYAFHASLPCISFSNAKNNAEETQLDAAMAQVTVRFIEAMTPKIVTFENVSMWRFSESWRLIQNALDRLGYWIDVQNHLNMADWGVPQTRKRMIVRAIRGGFLPPLPQPVPWRGWYQAIEDLIPGLPDSEFAPWQLARMPQELLDSMLVDSAGYPDEGGARVPVMRQPYEPANTIVANHARRPMRAFIVDCQHNHGTAGLTIRQSDEPVFTVTASANRRTVRAFIADGANAHRDNRLITTRKDGEPMFSVTAQSLTKNPIRAAVPGRVVKMTPRALARFQAIPDSYVLPDNDTLAVRVIGNAVPPLFMRQLLEPFA